MKKHSNLAFFIPHLGCPYKCVFCDQVNISGERRYPSIETVRQTCEEYLPEKSDTTEIAFFGGSFTAIPRNMMIGYLQTAFPFVQEGRANGIRISTRPDYIDRDILSILKKYGVTSIELGAQSMDDKVLELNGRGHSSQQVKDASRLITECGFSLGLQMMLGMYGVEDPFEDSMKTADAFISLHPDTVRIYPTLVVDNTELARLWEKGDYVPLDLDSAVMISAKLMRRFRENKIKVIRVGLHSEMSLQQQTLAGPFHPAFGELCESLLCRNQIEEALDGVKEATVYCSPRLLSKVKGQKKSNLEYFNQKGITLQVIPSDEVNSLTVVHP